MAAALAAHQLHHPTAHSRADAGCPARPLLLLLLLLLLSLVWAAAGHSPLVAAAAAAAAAVRLLSFLQLLLQLVSLLLSQTQSATARHRSRPSSVAHLAARGIPHCCQWCQRPRAQPVAAAAAATAVQPRAPCDQQCLAPIFHVAKRPSPAMSGWRRHCPPSQQEQHGLARFRLPPPQLIHSPAATAALMRRPAEARSRRLAQQHRQSLHVSWLLPLRFQLLQQPRQVGDDDLQSALTPGQRAH